MKKALFLSLLFGIIHFANAQSVNYRDFKFDITSGYALPTYDNSGVSDGATITLEPHYRLSDQLAIGFRYEAALLGYSSASHPDFDISGVGSYCFTGNYYLSNSRLRPFVGAGAGLFSQFASELIVLFPQPGEQTSSPTETRFGFFPTIGIETGHLRMSAEYNMTGNNSNYLSFKLGFFIGGGRR